MHKCDLVMINLDPPRPSVAPLLPTQMNSLWCEDALSGRGSYCTVPVLLCVLVLCLIGHLYLTCCLISYIISSLCLVHVFTPRVLLHSLSILVSVTLLVWFYLSDLLSF